MSDKCMWSVCVRMKEHERISKDGMVWSVRVAYGANYRIVPIIGCTIIRLYLEGMRCLLGLKRFFSPGSLFLPPS